MRNRGNNATPRCPGAPIADGGEHCATSSAPTKTCWVPEVGIQALATFTAVPVATRNSIDLPPPEISL